MNRSDKWRHFPSTKCHSWCPLADGSPDDIRRREDGLGRHLPLRTPYVRDDACLGDAHLNPAHPPFVVEYAREWQAIDKIVSSTTLQDVSSERTRIERSFAPEAVRALKSISDRDATVDGPDLAAQAIRAGLVDEYQPVVGPTAVGGGTPFFPSGLRLDLELLDEHRFTAGGIWLRYAPASPPAAT